jgi:hypothetical protein
MEQASGHSKAGKEMLYGQHEYLSLELVSDQPLYEYRRFG